MNRIIFFIIFIVIVSAVYFGLHFTVFKFFANSLDINGKHRLILKYFFWASGLSFLISMILSRSLNFHFLNYYAFIWMGAIASAFAITLIPMLLVRFFPNQAKAIAFVTLGIICISLAVSLFRGFSSPTVKNVTVPIKQLPQNLSGFTIVQVSDLHLEEFKSKKSIPELVDRINGLKPDLVALTGDLIDGKVCESPYICKHLKRLKSTYGVVAVTGNHEFFSDLRGFLRMSEKTGIKVLRNEHITVADSLQIIGIDDDEGHRFSGNGPDLNRAVEACDTSKPMILLYHRPLLFDEAVKKGVDLQLSGHTHAGQIPPMDLIVSLYYKYPAGLYEKDGSYIYTSAGTGYWGPPMRLFSGNEITKITLTN